MTPPRLPKTPRVWRQSGASAPPPLHAAAADPQLAASGPPAAVLEQLPLDKRSLLLLLPHPRCRNRGKGQYGCSHYRRRVKFITPCW